MTTSKYATVFTTTPSRALAARIARRLVDARLAACVQVTPTESTFRWQDKVQTQAEWVLAIKTTRRRYAALHKEIKRLHSYDVPEIITVPFTHGNKAYLDWLDDSTR